MVLTLPQRIRLVQLYYANGNSPTATLRAYGQVTGDYNVCTQRAVRDLIKKFEQTGSVINTKPAGRPRTYDDNDVMEINTAVHDLSQHNVHSDTSI